MVLNIIPIWIPATSINISSSYVAYIVSIRVRLTFRVIISFTYLYLKFSGSLSIGFR